MEIQNTRFGTVTIEAQDLLHFPQGLIGFEDCRHWVLLADGANEAVAWLQSVTDGQVALPVVSPRRFVPGYRLRVAPSQLDMLGLQVDQEIYVLAVLGRQSDAWTLNLKAPIVVNLTARLGTQVVSQDDQPLQLRLATESPLLRKTA